MDKDRETCVQPVSNQSSELPEAKSGRSDPGAGDGSAAGMPAGGWETRAHKAQILTTVFTALAFAAAAVYAYFAYEQVAMMQATLSSTNQLVQEQIRAVDAATRAAAAADQANKLATEALHQSDRAWIDVEIPSKTVKVDVKTVSDSSGTYELAGVVGSILAKNTGKSPAIHGFTFSNIAGNNIYDIAKQTNAACETADSVQKTDVALNIPGYVVFPGGTHPMDIATARHTSEMFEGANGLVPGMLVGCTVYRDQYGIRHHTRFCFEWIDPRTKGSHVEVVKPCPEDWDAN